MRTASKMKMTLIKLKDKDDIKRNEDDLIYGYAGPELTQP